MLKLKVYLEFYFIFQRSTLTFLENDCYGCDIGRERKFVREFENQWEAESVCAKDERERESERGPFKDDGHRYTGGQLLVGASSKRCHKFWKK